MATGFFEYVWDPWYDYIFVRYNGVQVPRIYCESISAILFFTGTMLLR